MRSNEKFGQSLAKLKTSFAQKAKFSKVLTSIKKPPVKPGDRNMVFMSYLLEKEFRHRLEQKAPYTAKGK